MLADEKHRAQTGRKSIYRLTLLIDRSSRQQSGEDEAEAPAGRVARTIALSEHRGRGADQLERVRIMKQDFQARKKRTAHGFEAVSRRTWSRR